MGNDVGVAMCQGCTATGSADADDDLATDLAASCADPQQAPPPPPPCQLTEAQRARITSNGLIALRRRFPGRFLCLLPGDAVTNRLLPDSDDDSP